MNVCLKFKGRVAANIFVANLFFANGTIVFCHAYDKSFIA